MSCKTVEILYDTEEPLVPGMVKAQPIIHRYDMPKAVEDEIRSTPYKFGYGGFSDSVYYRTYSRLKEDGTKENFHDTIVRVVKGIVSIAKDWRVRHALEWDEDRWDNMAIRFGKAMLKMQLLPPGRGLWISGTEYSYKRGAVAFNNCGFCSLKEGLVKCATWTIDSLACGCGIGFDTFEKVDENSIKEFDKFVIPGCYECRHLRNIDEIIKLNCSCKKRIYKIHDSREGWVKSVYLLLDSYFTGIMTYFDYSDLRLEGVPIKGFGGHSSGPEPLRILHERICLFIECYIDVNKNCLDAYETIINMTKKHILIYPENNTTERPSLIYALSELEKMDKSISEKKTYGSSRLICDIFNSIGICIVAGNVRRSSEISLGGATDIEFRNLKNHELNPERSIISWMSNNTVCLDKKEDFELLPEIAERIKDNGEPGILNRLNGTRYGRFGRRHPIGREAEEDKGIGTNPCVTGDTLVQTSYGYRRVDQLVGKQFSAVVDGKNYWSTSKGFWLTGIKDVYEIELYNGLKIKLTSNHKLLTKKENITQWKEVKDIVHNEKIILTENNDYKWNGIGTFEDGYFCGQLICDGKFKLDCPQICLWIKSDVNPLSHLGYIILENYAKSLNTGHFFNGWRKDRVNNKYTKYILQTEKFKEVSDKFGIYPTEKKVPEFGSYDFTVGLLRGLFDVNGIVIYKDYLSVILCNFNIEKLESVQRLLFSLGIYSSICKYEQNEGNVKYELSCSGTSVKRFFNTVGFYEQDKQNKLYNAIQKHNKEFYTKDYMSGVYSLLYLGKEAVYDCTIPGPNCFSAGGILAHNCSEILLESFEYCNLAEIFPSKCNKLEELEEAAYLATIYTSTVSLLSTHWIYSNKVIAKNRRTGVSMSGIIEDIARSSNTLFIKKCRHLYKLIRLTNKSYADENGVPESIRCTTVKPSGTISQLAGVSSGIHHNTYKYCIRRVRMGANTKLVEILKKAGYPYETDLMAGEGTIIFSFPLHQGNARTAEEVSVWEQASNLALMQREFADNSVSCTLYFNPVTEGPSLEHVLSHFAPVIKCLSALPHTEAGVYKQAPYEKITEEQYYEFSALIKPINFTDLNEEAEGTRGCDGDTCDIKAYSQK
jgi:ribonucleotide reductase alpha subunit